MKPAMLAFADEHFDVLARFGQRVATGTTGQRLNELAWSRGWPSDTPWVTRYQSGPMGGDAQIADRVLEGRCQRAIFFEDPHVARQHEADIQLLERAGDHGDRPGGVHHRTAGGGTLGDSGGVARGMRVPANG